MSALNQLQPQPLWKHFQLLCDTPRSSGQEQALCAAIKDWATELGLEVIQDAIGNLIIRKEATPGYENCPRVTLQGHLDMVTQKTPDQPHDFATDPIKPFIENDWIRATGTTLGADNGIGIAAAMAVLEAKNLAHGPIEALMTVDEEAGMTGVQALQSDQLKGSILLNLDTEEWGSFYIGCAGGVDVEVEHQFSTKPVNPAYQLYQLSINGLKGGHSGCDIHLGLGNANQLLVRVLTQIFTKIPAAQLIEFHGGSLRNAIPREASCLLALGSENASQVKQLILACQNDFLIELAGVDDDLTLSFLPIKPQNNNPALCNKDAKQFLNLLQATPHGVERMSQVIPGVVETSNNLGVVNLSQGKLSVCLLVRSLLDHACQEQATRLCGLFHLVGANTAQVAPYPGWAPKADSKILTFMQELYQQEFAEPAKIEVIHAGLECGLIGSKYPQMDMISFGPTIKRAHSPGETVEIESVEKFWNFLVLLLKNLNKMSN